jgi:hypothetical protein
MNAPKSHHYVPKMLLRNFTNEQGQLYFYRKDKASEGVKAASPEKLFAAQHLYSKTAKDGVRDHSLEQRFGKLETEAAQVFSSIMDAARSGHVPGLTWAQKEVVALFHYMQWKRSFDHRKTFLSDEVIFTQLDETATRAQDLFPNRVDDIARISTALRSKDYIHNLRIDILRTINPDTLNLLASRALVVAVPQKGSKSWIIGSSPVAKMGSADLRHPNSEIWLPIAPDVAVGFCQVGKPEELVVIPDMVIRRMNSLIALQSGMFAGRSEALIQSLAGHP